MVFEHFVLNAGHCTFCNYTGTIHWVLYSKLNSLNSKKVAQDLATSSHNSIIPKTQQVAELQI